MAAARASVADLAGDASDIAWSPDSRRIAAGTTSGLRIIDVAASTPPVKVTSGPTDDASFSPSGRYLAYVPLNATGRGKLRILDLKTRKTITVAKLGFAGALSWAPKQDVIAVCAGKRYNTALPRERQRKAKEAQLEVLPSQLGADAGPLRSDLKPSSKNFVVRIGTTPTLHRRANRCRWSTRESTLDIRW